MSRRDRFILSTALALYLWALLPNLITILD